MTKEEPREWYERDGRIVLGAMVRTLGAFPSGWRHPDAHDDPLADPKALKRLARAAEKAFLHEQFETFARLVVPELRSRGLFRDGYEETTLRGHLGSPVPTRGARTPVHVTSP